MNVCNEMRKLRKWLDGHDIEWVDVSDDFGIDIGDIDIWICRTHFEVGGGYMYPLSMVMDLMVVF